MDKIKREEAADWLALVDRLQESGLPEVDKVMRAFDYIVDQQVELGAREVELARAMKDRESVIREQIKMETIKYAQSSLRDCYRLFVGRKYDDE